MTTNPSSWLGIDVGQKRIGIAIASDEARLPKSLPTLNNDNSSMMHIKALVEQYSVAGIIVGLPHNLDGDETQQSQQIRDFAGKLHKVLGKPLYFQDETLSSVRAREELESREIAYNKEDVDALAAVLILTDWLDVYLSGEPSEKK